MDDDRRSEEAARMLRKRVRLRHRLEQQLAEVADLLPGFAWQLYTQSRAEGFSDDQAMALVLSYIEASSTPLF